MSISRSLSCLTVLVGIGASLSAIALVAADGPSDPKLPPPADREVGFVKDVQPEAMFRLPRTKEAGCWSQAGRARGGSGRWR